MAVKRGDLVKFHYTAQFEDGEIFASTRGKGPIGNKVGEGRLIRGIEDALVGMEISEKKEIIIPPDRGGYGQRDETLIKKFPKKTLGDIEEKLGKIIRLENEEGHVFNARVLAIETDAVTLDLNHPLAGKTLRFDIEILEIK